MLILVFDTETSGLPKSRSQSIMESHNWPFILQIAWILYDSDKNLILEKANKIIKISDNVTIDKESTDIHKITKEICNEKGENIINILKNFNLVLNKCDIIVGHNLKFDKNMVMIEGIRNNIFIKFNNNGINKDEYCTMINQKNVCKIPFKNGKIGTDYKYPRLEELVNFIFNEKHEGFHDAFIDIIFTLRCYLKIIYNNDLFLQNPEIKNYLKN